MDMIDKFVGGVLTRLLTLSREGIKFNTTQDPTSTPVEGQVWWNRDDHTLNIQGDVLGTVLQVGQENWLRAHNSSGVTISEGEVVYISGANSARPTITKAIASIVGQSDKVIGVATHDILTNSLGVVTTFGLVRGLATNVDGDGVAMADGDCIYLSATTAGKWVKTKPHAPNHCIKIGQVVNAGPGGSGNIFISVHTGSHLQDLHDVNIETGLSDGDFLYYDAGTGIWKNKRDSSQDTKEETGFVDPKNVGVSYNSVNRTITLTHSSGTVYYYCLGTRYSVPSGWTSTAHGSSFQSYFLSLGPNATVTWTTSFPGFSGTSGAYTAYAYYQSSDKFAIRECHGLMPWQAWEELHNQIGTYRKSGGLVPSASWAANTNTVVAVTPAVEEAVIADEDLDSTINSLPDGGPYTTLHFINNLAVFTTGSTFPFINDGTEVQYNPNGTSLAVVGANNRFYNVYGILVPVTSDAASQNYRIIWLTGQLYYSTSSAAQSEDFRTLNLGNLSTIFTELVPYIRITIQREGTYANTKRARFITGAITYIVGNKQNLVSVSGVTPTDHATLTGRTSADSHPASAISNTAYKDLAAANVQASLEYLLDRIAYQIDGGEPTSIYGGTSPIDGGTP
jgi:hypothetical protein